MISSEQCKEEPTENPRWAVRFAQQWDELRYLSERLDHIESSTAWSAACRLAQWRRCLAPEGSRRYRWLRSLLRRFRPSLEANAGIGDKPTPIQAAIPGETDRRDKFSPSDVDKFRVVFIGSSAACEAQSMRYRAHNIIEALPLAGLEATFVPLEDARAKLDGILSHDLIVLVRLTWNDATADLVASVRRRNLPLVYDIDDYLFDPWILPYVEAFRVLTRSEALRIADSLAACLEQCDYFTGSNSYLADKAAALGKVSFVIANGLNGRQIERARQAVQQRNAHSRQCLTRLGYFSGTRTHQADFRIIYPALMRLLREHRHVRLTIVGDLDVGEFPGLAPCYDQIEILPLRHWLELPEAMSRISVNLIPLELTPFNEGKSNLKYFEAGLVQVPSIASPTRINRDNIIHGHNGMLAQTSEEWHRALNDLLANAECREQMGQNAYRHVRDNYVPLATATQAVEVYRQILQHHHRKIRSAA